MQLYIIYAPNDKYLARQQIVQQLQRVGHTVDFDEVIHPSMDWQGTLKSRIQQSERVIFVITSAAIKSEYCLWELHQAVMAKKPISYIELEQTDLPEPFNTYPIVKLHTGVDAWLSAPQHNEPLPEYTITPEDMPSRVAQVSGVVSPRIIFMIAITFILGIALLIVAVMTQVA